MKTIALFIAVILVSTQAYARKDCEELRNEIAEKIEANGVEDYSLDIVSAEEIEDQKVVGSCDGDTKRIVYKRN